MSLPELSDAQLDKMNNGVEQYLGCYSKDQLPTAKRLNGKFAIVNMQSHNAGNGTHWVLLYDVDPQHIIYVDSEGAPPPKNVERLMMKSQKEPVWNNIQVQKLGSSSCGWWADMFANELLSGKSLPKIISQFSKKNQSANESKLKLYYGRS